MDGPTEICNFALNQLGTSAEIENLETDTSANGRVMRRVYETTRREILHRYNWYFSTRYELLQLVNLYPDREWAFSYRYPNSCLNLIKIWNGTHSEDQDNMVRFIISSDDKGKLILSDFGPTELLSGDPTNSTPAPAQSTTPSVVTLAQYVADVTDTTMMPPMFKTAFAFFLAAYAANSLPGPGPADAREKNLAIAEQRLLMAISRDQNEAKAPRDYKSILEKARRGKQGYWTTQSGAWTPGFDLNWSV